MNGHEAIGLSEDGAPIGRILGGNGRLTTYRNEGGKLMCRSQAGLLCSEVPVVASLCGGENGCNGRWFCLTRSIEKLIITSESELSFTSKV